MRREALFADAERAGREAEISAWKSPGNLCALYGFRFAMLASAQEPGIQGRSDMANRLPSIAAFLSAFLTFGVTEARAADPGFCRQYARAATSQVRGALADPHCGAAVQGARWSTDFPVHYEWCLGASVADAGAERDARTRYLRACASR